MIVNRVMKQCSFANSALFAILLQTRIRRFLSSAIHRRELLRYQWKVYDERRIAEFKARREKFLKKLKYGSDPFFHAFTVTMGKFVWGSMGFWLTSF